MVTGDYYARSFLVHTATGLIGGNPDSSRGRAAINIARPRVYSPAQDLSHPGGRHAAQGPDAVPPAIYIDGKWVDADSGKTIAGRTIPATGETLGKVPKMGAAETRRAIEAANRGAAGLARQDRRRSAPRSCANGST